MKSGQVLIFVLMVMVVGLTIGLAAASRSITDVRLSTQSEQAERAFAAAEAGVEEALARNIGVLVASGTKEYSGVVGEVPYTVTIKKAEASNVLASSKPVAKDDVIQILTKSDDDPQIDLSGATITVYWVDTSNNIETNDPAALEVTEIYQSGDSYLTKRYGFKPNVTESETVAASGFKLIDGCSSDCAILGKNYRYKANVSLSDGTLMLRFRPLSRSSSTSIGVKVSSPGTSGDANFPPQSYEIEGVGTVGNVVRRVKVNRSLETLPSIFDYALFAGGSISK